MPIPSPDGRMPAALLASTLVDAAVVVDRDGRVVAWNGAAAIRLGIAARAAGSTLQELGLSERARAATRLALAGEGTQEGGAILVWRPSGRLDPMDLELQRARTLARIAPGAAHDANNRLTGVAGFSRLLRDDPAAIAGYGEETLALVEASSRAAIALVRGFTTLAREPRAGTELVGVGPLLADLLLLVDDRLPELRRHVDIAEDLPEVEGNRAGIRQALAALLVSSLEALGLPRPSGRLEVRARLAVHGGAPSVEVSFEDDAAPVPPGDRAHLFDAQPPAGCTPRAGLDLAVARQLLEDDGGSLRYEAGADGRNRFVAALPPAGRSPATDTRVADAGTADEPITALICDDDPGVALLMARLVGRAGIRTIVAGSGAQALEVMGREHVDAVITDHSMQGMSGVDLHAEASERHPRLRSRFILVSGDPGDPALVAFARRTGLPVLGKPFTATELVDLVRRAVGA